jgi:hypothetical protein
MSSPVPILITLDRPRPIRWTARAEARNSSLTRPQSFGALARGKNRFGALCTIVWAALVDKDHEFEAPEDLAEYLKTGEQQVGAFKALGAMVAEAFPEKKTVPRNEPSKDGPSESSSSASPPASTHGN